MQYLFILCGTPCKVYSLLRVKKSNVWLSETTASASAKIRVERFLSLSNWLRIREEQPCNGNIYFKYGFYSCCLDLYYVTLSRIVHVLHVLCGWEWWWIEPYEGSFGKKQKKKKHTFPTIQFLESGTAVLCI